jgi:predicted SprT family Zn-dependent metalloprotease
MRFNQFIQKQHLLPSHKSFIDKEGNSTHVLYIQKGYMVKDKDFKEIMEALNVRFKKK